MSTKIQHREYSMDKIVALAKSRGFVFPGSEIYGGLANTWDYGPIGVELKNNVKAAWRKKFIQESRYNVGLDSAILMNPKTWEASGHVGNFNDPQVDCKVCRERFRADKLIEEYFDRHGIDQVVDGWTNEQMETFMAEKGIKCPTCGSVDFTPIRQFNLMFKTFQGVTEDSTAQIYLRPETAQGIFVNFKNVQRSARKKIPFGIAQIGKSFRNEITPGNFTFRTREFEQMELEFFCAPGTDMEWFDYWRGLFPFGWGELWGIAHRSDYDLRQHQEFSGQDMSYQDPVTNEKFIPFCIEPSLGADRVTLAFLVEAYDEQTIEGANGKEDTRTVLHFHPALAPYKAAVLPLTKKQAEKAEEFRDELAKYFSVDYDLPGSIGKRYRRHRYALLYHGGSGYGKRRLRHGKRPGFDGADSHPDGRRKRLYRGKTRFLGKENGRTLSPGPAR